MALFSFMYYFMPQVTGRMQHKKTVLKKNHKAAIRRFRKYEPRPMKWKTELNCLNLKGWQLEQPPHI
jgi:hypothetical protein